MDGIPQRFAQEDAARRKREVMDSDGTPVRQRFLSLDVEQDGPGIAVARQKVDLLYVGGELEPIGETRLVLGQNLLDLAGFELDQLHVARFVQFARCYHPLAVRGNTSVAVERNSFTVSLLGDDVVFDKVVDDPA